jgi:CheY-like chemotaxis protein/tetratricopeptide (TPR) repeat protein
MLGKKPEGTNPILKEKIAKHLRAADARAREGRYEEAMLELEYVLRIDPKHLYARSFQERIRGMQKKTQKEAEARAVAETSDIERRLEMIAQLLKAADNLIGLRQYQQALDQVAKVFALDPTNYYAQAYSERIEVLMREGPKGPPPAPAQPAVQPAAEPAAPPPTPTAQRTPPPDEKGRLAMYRELLKEMWFDGILNEREQTELKKVRDTFNISDAEHAQAEKEIKVDAYVEGLRIALRDGVLSENEERVLELMRKRFNITMEEHMSAEAKILSTKQSPDSRATILVVDDEKTFLLSLAARLKKHNYEVVTAESVEDAMRIMERTVPALILSDVMFPPPGAGGFEFYKKVRNDPRTATVPFLLMSGISDEFVVRAGMRMGIDGYLTKPFTLELLLATIEGRLK